MTPITMPEYELFRITQNVVLINNEGKALILQHPKGKWLLPGGKIDKGEAWCEGLNRELVEEAGITDYAIISIIDVDSWVEKGHPHYAVTFVGTVPKDTAVIISDEHTSYAWVDAGTVDRYDFWHPSLPERIKKGIKIYNGTLSQLL